MKLLLTKITEKFAQKPALALFIVFLLFFSIQIPVHSSNPDALVYSARSTAVTPVLDYAFLSNQTLLGAPAIYNYHLAHTIILWMMDKIIPGSGNFIWISGFVSAISGALIVLLTYLIGLNLGFTQKTSVIFAVIAGLVPSIWFYSLIGEVYTLQLVFILLFCFFFLKDNMFFAFIFFLLAVLVTPISGLAITFGLFGYKNYKTLIKLAAIGTCALICYLIIFYFLHSNILGAFGVVDVHSQAKSLLYRLLVFLFIIVINFSFFIPMLIKGFVSLSKSGKQLFIPWILVFISQFILVLLDPQFVVENGSFQLPVFWLFSIPLAMYSSTVKNYKTVVLNSVGVFIIFLLLWILPDQLTAHAYEHAVDNLKEHHNNVKIIGDWGTGAGIACIRSKGDLSKINNNYFERPAPDDKEIELTGEEKLIITVRKRTSFRKFFSKLPVSGFKLREYNPVDSIHIGQVTPIYQNDYVAFYLWEKYK